MKAISLIVWETPGEKFKVKVFGQPDLHIMDWAGCNFRSATVPGQPHRGFRKPSDAIKWAQATFKNDREAFGTIDGDGTFMSDNDMAQWETFKLVDELNEPTDIASTIDSVRGWSCSWIECDDCGEDLDDNEVCPECRRDFK